MPALRALLLSAAALALCGAPGAAAPAGGRPDQCAACVALLEGAVADVRAGDVRSDARIADALAATCDSPAFANFTAGMRGACAGLAGQGALALAPTDVDDDAAVWQHVQDACVAARACRVADVAPAPVEQHLPAMAAENARCESCKLLCADVQAVADRQEKLRNNDLAKGLINQETICDAVGLRHGPAAAPVIERECEALFEASVARNESTGAVVGNNLARLIVMRNGFKAKGWQPSQSLEEKVCVELTGFCEDISPYSPPSGGAAVELEVDAGGRAAPAVDPTPAPVAEQQEPEAEADRPAAPKAPSEPCDEWRALPASGATDQWCSSVCGGSCVGKLADAHPFPDYCRCSVVGSNSAASAAARAAAAAEKEAPAPNAPAAAASSTSGDADCPDPAPAKPGDTAWLDAPSHGQTITRAVLKGPVHTTCQIKQYPGLKDFHKGAGASYPGLTIKGYVQPPHFLFHSADGALVEKLFVPKEATAGQYEQLLQMRGLRR